MVKNPVESKDGAACIARAYEESVLPGHIISGPGAMHVCMHITFFFLLGPGKYVHHSSDVSKRSN